MASSYAGPLIGFVWHQDGEGCSGDRWKKWRGRRPMGVGGAVLYSLAAAGVRAIRRLGRKLIYSPRRV